MNYYKSTKHPHAENITFKQFTANGDYYYYMTDEITNDEAITEEQFLAEKAKEIHVDTQIEQPKPTLEEATALLEQATNLLAEILKGGASE